MPPLIGGLVEGKESTIPLTAILTPELWNVHDGVRVLCPCASKLLQYQRLKFQVGINRELGGYMEERLLVI